jgi:hypothetical protein
MMAMPEVRWVLFLREKRFRANLRAIYVNEAEQLHF